MAPPLAGIHDAAAVALQHAISNGSLSRRPGWLELVALTAQLPLALLGADQILRTGGRR